MSYGFKLEQETEVPELNVVARLYRHEKSGGLLLSLINDDENKCFGAAFRTPPSNSTGVPHILEHGVLNGSRKYPVKEPFVELVKGSFNTFLNAMTFPDKTVYPVASTNDKDFYNLVDVYLDAVFHPLIPSHVLDQEGWHYEIDSVEKPLEFKGVVFNEMKGVYSSPDSRLGSLSQQSIFPDTAYGYDSGGDPTVIPELTYKEFKGFHERYYHPANALLFFYGDDDPEQRLRLLDEYLRDYDAKEIDAFVGIQPGFPAPRSFTYPYAASDETDLDKKSMLAVNWMLSEAESLEDEFARDILSDILLGNQAAPLRKALIDSGLGENLTGGGLDEYTRQPTFSVGMKGIRSIDAEKIEALIFDTLRDLAETGIEKEIVEASMNTLEFRLRENNTGSFPRGLVLMFAAMGGWTYGKDPIEPLFFEKPLSDVRKRFENGERIFENLIREHLLENPHRTTVLLEPDPEMGVRKEVEERARLDSIRANLSESQIADLVENTKTLKRLQSTSDTAEALATLPFLTLEDLNQKNKVIPKEDLNLAGVPTIYHDLFTNGIVYLDIGFDLHVLPQDLLPYVPLFNRSLLGLGTESEDFVQLTRRIGRKTGGLYPTAFVSMPFKGSEAASWFFLRGKGTMPQVPDLLAIMKDVLLTVKFDNKERFRQLVMESKSSKESRLIPAGHSMVNTRLRSNFGESYWVNELFGGVSSLYFVRELAEEFERDWPAILSKLERIRALLINRSSAILNITLDRENWLSLRPKLEGLINELPQLDLKRAAWTPVKTPSFEGLAIPAQVNYVGKGANLYEHGYQSHGSAMVINNLLRTTWLWEKIRVQGGAYGGLTTWDRFSGMYTFISYRDPNLLGTLENFDGTPDFLAALDITDSELTKAIIGTISDLDTYQLPDAKGYTSLVRQLVGVSEENRQQLREEILGTTRRDFKNFAEALKSVRDHGNVVVMGSAEAIQGANEAHGGDWLKVQNVL